MAEASGTDVLLKIMATGERIEAEVKAVGEQVKALGQRLDRTNDTVMLLGSVLHRAVEAVKGRLDDHERRLADLER